MKRSRFPLAIVSGLICLLLPIPEARAAVFSVDTTADFVDANPGDGICSGESRSCSLRAAIQEANALPGAHGIVLPAGVYSLTLVGRGEELAATGDLDIRSKLTIWGKAAEATIVDGGQLDRIFHVLPGFAAAICDVTVQNGDPGDSASGGAILNLGNLKIIGSTVTNNSAQSGGGILNAGADSRLEIRDSTLTGNSAATSGGAVFNTGHLTITLSRLKANTAFDSGGAIASVGDLNVDHSTIENNSVDLTPNGGSKGGGISTVKGGQISDTTVSGNRAQIGGGISNVSGVLSLKNSTISGNAAAIEVPPGEEGILFVLPVGGGVFTGPTAVSNIVSCTFSGNTTDFSGPSLATLGTTHMRNTILTDGCEALGPGSLQSLGHNFGPSACNLAQPTDIILASNGDPHLGPLTNNGGPTETQALLPGSLAINAGAGCPPRDQRGVARAKCDIGAYERGQFADLSVTKNVRCESVLAGSLVKFRIETFNFGPNRATNVRVTDRLPRGLVFVAARPSQGSCAAVSDRGTETEIACDLGAMPSDGAAEVTVDVVAGDPGVWANLVFVGSPDAELDRSNNQARANLTVLSRESGRIALSQPQLSTVAYARLCE